MARRQLRSVRREFEVTLEDCKRFANDAFLWASPGSVPHITIKRRDALVELAFFRMYLAWEVFLEEAFILYLLGSKVRGRKAPHRFSFPPNEKAAREWIIPELQHYAKWDAQRVAARALRFFGNGYPFAQVLRGKRSLLEDSRTIRNVVAHGSENARGKFEAFLRRQTQTLPVGSTVGAFLGTTVAGSSPPTSFLETYLSELEFMASKIVPS